MEQAEVLECYHSSDLNKHLQLLRKCRREDMLVKSDLSCQHRSCTEHRYLMEDKHRLQTSSTRCVCVRARARMCVCSSVLGLLRTSQTDLLHFEFAASKYDLLNKQRTKQDPAEQEDRRFSCRTVATSAQVSVDMLCQHSVRSDGGRGSRTRQRTSSPNPCQRPRTAADRTPTEGEEKGVRDCPRGLA